MDPVGFCTQTRVLIVAGKGGVGKTTVSAALARMAGEGGLQVLIVEVEGKSGLAAAFGQPEELSYRERVLFGAEGGGQVRARTLTPDEALVEYLEEHGMRRISRRLASSGLVDVVSTAIPGIKDILVLGKVKQLERASVADLILIDAPAAGHAVTFLTSASGLLDSVRGGPLQSQAREVVDLLSDDRRCQVLLVTLPEETPVNEVVETAYALEDRVGISLAGVVVNGLYPALEGLGAPLPVASEHADVLRAAADFRLSRAALHAEQVQRLASALPLSQLHLPFLFSAEIGERDVEALAQALARALAGVPSQKAVLSQKAVVSRDPAAQP